MAQVIKGDSPSQYGRKPGPRPSPPPVITQTPPERANVEVTGELCAECFPDGLPGGWGSAGCIHGNWTVEEAK